jgi:hypothetical protein
MGGRRCFAQRGTLGWRRRGLRVQQRGAADAVARGGRAAPRSPTRLGGTNPRSSQAGTARSGSNADPTPSLGSESRGAARDAGLAASGPSGRVARRGRRSGAGWPSGASVPHTSWRHQPSLVARGHGSDWVKCGPYAGFGIGVARRGAGRWLAASGPSGRVARRGRRSGAAGARPRADGAREAARASNPSGAGRRAVAIARSAPCSVRGGSSRARASPRSRAARAQSALESGRAARSHVGP